MQTKHHGKRLQIIHQGKGEQLHVISKRKNTCGEQLSALVLENGLALSRWTPVKQVTHDDFCRCLKKIVFFYLLETGQDKKKSSTEQFLIAQCAMRFKNGE